MSDTVFPRVHVFSRASQSGITAYARDFEDVALRPNGYIQTDPEIVLESLEIYPPDSRFHIQLGVAQWAERRAMTALLKAGFNHVEATIHDPPFLTFPFFDFESRWLTRLSRGFDWYLRSFGIQRRAIGQLERVFVLSEIGRSRLLQHAPAANVKVIPLIARAEDIWPSPSPLPPALIYFGFIGPNKGLEYVFDLHRAINRLKSGTVLHVVGAPNGPVAEKYLADLQARYVDFVHYHGYVPDEQLDEVFALAGHVVLPYAAYKHIVPTSGSVVQALRRGRIAWVSGVNAVPETIRDGDNGFILSMEIERDARRIADVMDDETLCHSIGEKALASARHSADYPYQRLFT